MNKNAQPEKAAKNRSDTAVQQNGKATPPKRRKKLRFKPNKEGMAQLLLLLVVVALIITAIVFGVKGIIYLVNKLPEETTTDSGTQPPATLPWNNAYAPIDHANTNIAVGDLILVNFENKYELTDTIKSKLTKLSDLEGYSTYYVLSGIDLGVRSSIANSLNDMIHALVDANPDTLGGKAPGTDRIIISSGYRDLQKQTELYDNRGDGDFVAMPGHSEHHTGYAVDIQIFTAKGGTTQLRAPEQEWMEAHCAEYGFVIRYDGSKHALTGIMDEPWHYRYVGVPHATYMTEHNLCLEEYLESLRTSHTYDKTPLEIKAGEKDYLVYYVPATENQTFTSIPVPPASEGSYSISGDNMNGFIVTVEKAAN